MKKIVLSRKAVKYDIGLSAYILDLSVTAVEGIITTVFVKQRVRNPLTNTFVDVFAAIASPEQLESLDVNSPSTDTSFFLVDRVLLTGSSTTYLDDVFNSIIADLQKLVSDVEVLEDLEPDGIYTITASNVSVDMGIPHTHYRIPLYAQPCGTNHLYTVGTAQYQDVGSENVALKGWLNTTFNGYKFKYNIATDPTLNALWPITSDKIPYVSVEVNGYVKTSGFAVLSDTNVLGLYWLDNLYGNAPWPEAWISEATPVLPQYQVTLVLDFIK